MEGQGLRERKLRENREAYETACARIGGTPHVFRYYDQEDELSIDLLTAEDVPEQGLVSYSTLGLLHAPVGRRADGKPLRYEIAGICPREYEYFPNLLSRCAFEVLNAHFSCAHGSVYRDVVQAYLPGVPVKHLLLLENPDFWGGEPFPCIDLPEKQVRWLGIYPLWDQEADLPLGELLPLLHGISPWDWTRPPLV